MIKLNSQKNEKGIIIDLIDQSINNPELELECIISDNHQYSFNQVSYQQFVNVIKRVKNKNQFESSRTLNKLNISFPLDSKFKDIRVIIVGYQAISTYCNNEKVTPILNNVIFESKKLRSSKNNQLTISDYGLKFNLKKESQLNKDDSIIRELLREWDKIPKTFRYKKTFTFKDTTSNYKIDLSIVKSSSQSDQYITIGEIEDKKLFKKVIKPKSVISPFSEWWAMISKNKDEKVLVQNLDLMYKNVQESRVFTNKPIYEVEVEYIKNKLPNFKIPKFNKIQEKKDYLDIEFHNYFKYIGIILQSIQNSFFILSYKEKQNFSNQYQLMLKKIVKNNQENFKVNENDNVSKLIKFYPNRLFFGPLAVDLTPDKLGHFDADKLTDDQITTNNNIKINYLVTDKADGERNLLVINHEGECFSINRENYVKKIGLTMPEYADSVFDTEIIHRDVKGNYCNNIHLFDAYVIQGDYIMNKAFNWNKESGRHIHLKRMEKYFNTGKNIIQENNKMPLLVYIKNYLPSDSPNTIKNNQDSPQIFKSCKELLSKMNKKYCGLLDEGHLFSYPTDGLVFIPNNLGIYQSYQDDKIINPFVSKRWNMNYKWKCGPQLTIDLKVMFSRKLTDRSMNYIYLNNKKYVQSELYCKVYHRSDNNQINYHLLNHGMKLEFIPEDFKFSPSLPFLGFVEDGELYNNAHNCYLEVDLENNVKCHNGDIITNDTTVEFQYDVLAEDEELRWIPIRNRPDKNPNGFNTASDIWRLIHQPISTSDICGHQMETTVENSIYYQNNFNVEYKTQPLKQFNNFVKDYLIERGLNNLNKPFVLDMACGKMGDFFKYVKNDVYCLVGLDINGDNLHNKIDGAATRIMNNIHSSSKINKMSQKTLLIQADVSKSISNGEAAINVENQFYLDILYGRVKPKNNKLVKMMNLGLEGFHLVSCMYAIHYMFRSTDTLEQFLLNVSQNLRDQGYFIGTCLDGTSIVSAFKGKNMIYGEVDEKTIFTLNKKEDVDYTNLTVGNKIDVFFETFNESVEEYLVNMEYLEEKAKDYDLKLIESNLFLDEPGNLLNQYSVKDKKNKDYIENNEDLEKWASWNRYFIFQKVTNLNE
jgi:hypothetical protein